MTLTLAYRISRDLSHLYCDVHHLSLSTRNSKELTVVKTCCSYFRNDIEKELNKRLGTEFVKQHIRFQLPIGESTAMIAGNPPEE